MAISREDIKNDPLFQQMIIRKKLKQNTINSYIQVLHRYCNFTGMTPSQLRGRPIMNKKILMMIWPGKLIDTLRISTENSINEM